MPPVVIICVSLPAELRLQAAEWEAAQIAFLCLLTIARIGFEAKLSTFATV